MRYVAKGMATAKLMCASAISQRAHMYVSSNAWSVEKTSTSEQKGKKGPLRHVPFTVEKNAIFILTFKNKGSVAKASSKGWTEGVGEGTTKLPCGYAISTRRNNADLMKLIIQYFRMIFDVFVAIFSKKKTAFIVQF